MIIRYIYQELCSENNESCFKDYRFKKQSDKCRPVEKDYKW